ncbi:hypothetical protein [Novosphingobium sp.]|uniref:hypothetical protein n=1 Tax=Novosphingobium sp. TaxID=1874826 RepID=UPI0038BBC024
MQLLIAAGLLGALLAPPAPQANEVFTRCDGYPAPGRSDGFLRGTMLLGLVTQSEDRRPAAITVGAEAVPACDAALADPRLKPEFTYRRTNLLLAKAVHLMASHKPADALAVLDAEQAAAPAGDRLRDAGVGIASRLLRAKALIDLRRRAEALAVLGEVEAMRPYAASDRVIASLLRMEAQPGIAAYLADVRRNAPLMPGLIAKAMVAALGAGRMEEAAALGRGLTVSLPVMRGNWKVEGYGASDKADIALRGQFAGMLGYALLASGKSAEADAVMDAADAARAKAVEPPPPPLPGKRWSRSVEGEYNERLVQGGKAEAALKGWRAAMTLRRQAANMMSEEVFAQISNVKAPEIQLVLADIVGQITKLDPGEQAARQGFIDKQHIIVETYLQRMGALTFPELLGALPRPETPNNQPKIHKAGDGYFLSDNGYSSTQMDLPERWTVRFTSDFGTAASVDEQAIASAAALARSKGYGHFIIELRRQMVRTLHQVGLYAGGDINSGREAQMTIRFVKPDALPDDLKGAEWRIVDAAKVLADFDASHPVQP